MVASHKYEPVQVSDEYKDDINVDVKEFNDGPRELRIPVTTAWWKILLGNLVAAGVGAGIMFAISRSTISTQSIKATPAAVEHVEQSTSSASASTVTVIQTVSPQPPLPTPTIHAISDDAPPVVLDCGYSPEEARAKGCIYDVMMQDWVPEPCYDEVLTEQYLAQGNWTWYADGDGNRTMTDEEMRRGEHGAAWMSTSYHKAHCVFSWMKIIRALRHSKGISEELLSYDHVLHCSHGALKANIEPGKEDIGVKAPTNYARCAVYEDWKKDFIPDKHDSESKRHVRHVKAFLL